MKLISISYETGFPPGVVYDASKELGVAHLRAKLAQKIISVEGQGEKFVKAQELIEEVQGPDLPPWGKKVTPAAYLMRYPKAPLAEVAQLYVDAGLGEVKGGG